MSVRPLSCSNPILGSRKEGKYEFSVICIEVMIFHEQEEIRVLTGMVQMKKSKGPRTEPWGTPQKDVYQEDRLSSWYQHLTQKQQDERHEETAESRAMDTKPGWQAGDQDVMVNSVESSREVEQDKTWLHTSTPYTVGWYLSLNVCSLFVAHYVILSSQVFLTGEGDDVVITTGT